MATVINDQVQDFYRRGPHLQVTGEVFSGASGWISQEEIEKVQVLIQTLCCELFEHQQQQQEQQRRDFIPFTLQALGVSSPIPATSRGLHASPLVLGEADKTPEAMVTIDVSECHDLSNQGVRSHAGSGASGKGAGGVRFTIGGGANKVSSGGGSKSGGGGSSGASGADGGDDEGDDGGEDGEEDGEEDEEEDEEDGESGTGRRKSGPRMVRVSSRSAKQRERHTVERMTMVKEMERLQNTISHMKKREEELQEENRQLKKLEVEMHQLKRTNLELTMEKRHSHVKLQEVEEKKHNLDESMMTRTTYREMEAKINALTEEIDNLKKQNETLQQSRFTELEEVVYLRWVNACLRYECRNVRRVPGKYTALDLNNSKSPRSQQLAKHLMSLYSKQDGEGGGMMGGEGFDPSAPNLGGFANLIPGARTLATPPGKPGAKKGKGAAGARAGFSGAFEEDDSDNELDDKADVTVTFGTASVSKQTLIDARKALNKTGSGIPKNRHPGGGGEGGEGGEGDGEDDDDDDDDEGGAGPSAAGDADLRRTAAAAGAGSKKKPEEKKKKETKSNVSTAGLPPKQARKALPPPVSGDDGGAAAPAGGGAPGGPPRPPGPPPPPGTPRAPGAPPPPPPPGGLKKMQTTKKGGVQRAPDVIQLYQKLFKRDGSAKLAVKKDDDGGHDARSEMVNEIEGRSSHLMEVKQDVEVQGEFINYLATEVTGLKIRDMDKVVLFVEWLDNELSYLVDERAVLKHFPDWPEGKTDALREAVAEYNDLKKLEQKILNTQCDDKVPVDGACKMIFKEMDRVEDKVMQILRTRDQNQKKYKGHDIPADWLNDNGMIGKVKVASVSLAKKLMQRVAKELKRLTGDVNEPIREYLLLQAVRFAFKVHQFAGGFDEEAMRVFEVLRAIAMEREEEMRAAGGGGDAEGGGEAIPVE